MSSTSRIECTENGHSRHVNRVGCTGNETLGFTFTPQRSPGAPTTYTKAPQRPAKKIWITTCCVVETNRFERFGLWSYYRINIWASHLYVSTSM